MDLDWGALAVTSVGYRFPSESVPQGIYGANGAALSGGSLWLEPPFRQSLRDLQKIDIIAFHQTS